MAVAQFYLAGYSIKMEKKETLTATPHTCPVINGWTLIKFSVQGKFKCYHKYIFLSLFPNVIRTVHIYFIFIQCIFTVM